MKVFVLKKIAIISDIHGNLEALRAVLKDIKHHQIDEIYCLGDLIGKGVHSKECFELVKKNCSIIIRGNSEDFYCIPKKLEEYENLLQQRIIWNQSKLSQEDQYYLSHLPLCHEFYMSGSLIRLFHATPNSLYGNVINLDTLEQKRMLFLPGKFTISKKNADLVFYGHTHAVSMEMIYNRTIVNVGSVGLPNNFVDNDIYNANAMEVTKAHYVILEGNYGSKVYDDNLSISFQRVIYDLKKELSSEEFYLEREDYELELLEGRYQNKERLRKSFMERSIDIDQF